MDEVLSPLETIWMKIDTLTTTFVAQLPNIVVGLFVILLAWLLAMWARMGVERWFRRSKFSNQVGIAFGRIGQYTVLLLGVFLALITIFPSLNMATLIEVLGIGGIAVGFAFRGIFENFLAGLLLLMNEPFQIGDQIIYADFEGTVIDIETRSTTIRTYDGREIIVPNADLYTNPVTVNTANQTRRYETVIGIAYDSDVDLARRVALEAVRDVESVLRAPEPSVLITEFADSSINLRVRWWAKSPNVEGLITTDEMLTNLVNRFREAGIAIPFPTREIVFNTPLETTTGQPLLSNGVAAS